MPATNHRSSLRSNAADVEVIGSHGIVLGVDPRANYQRYETTLEPADRLVIYTDGLTEASNELGDSSRSRACESASSRTDILDAQELADALFEDVKAYSNDNMRDDTTILVVRRLA